MNLERTIKNSLGEEIYTEALQDAKSYFDYLNDRDVLKSPAAMELVLRYAAEKGKEVGFLHQVLEKVIEMTTPRIYIIDKTDE